MTDIKSDLLKAFTELLDKAIGDPNKEVEALAVVPEITKAVEVEQRKALFIVLEPCGLDNPDLHGDIYTAEEVEKAADNFNRFCGKASIQHLVQTEKAEILESYITPVSFVLDTGKVIQKGTWLQNWYFPETEDGEMLWKDVKESKFTGLSIGAKATTEEL
jgi:hypothetical protein